MKIQEMWQCCFCGKNKDADEENRDQTPAADAAINRQNPPVTSNQNAGASASTDRARGNAVIISYGELARITRNFHEDSIIGHGGFGPVYKGTLEATNQDVAMKRLNDPGRQGEQEFTTAFRMLCNLRHPHLANLIGYCSQGANHLLVYQHLPSLDNHLYEPKPPLEPLDWETRMTIALGAARGLHYLHNEVGRPVLFIDFTTANILLDEGFHPRLTDFGTANFDIGDRMNVSTRLPGTPGYMAPEFVTSGRLSTNSDVYSFGAILVALITGRTPVDFVRTMNPPLLYNWLLPKMNELHTVVDAALGEGYERRSLQSAAELALACLQQDPDVRPAMPEVVQKLEEMKSAMRDEEASTSRG